MRPRGKLADKILEFLSTGEKTQVEISRALGLSRSRTSEILSELEIQGKIIRRKISERTIEVKINRDSNLIVGILPSSEYVYLIEAIEDLGLNYILKIFNNSLEGFKELILGQIDILASPLVSGYIFFLLDERIKPIMGIARGGGGIIKKSDRGILGTTPFSKMDRLSRQKKGFQIVYYKGIEELLEAYGKGKVDAISIWEPYLTLYGGKPENNHETCCALFGNVLNDLKEKLIIKYVELTESNSKPERGIKVISEKLGFEPKIIEKSLKSYEFDHSISKDDLEKQLRALGIGMAKNLGDFLGNGHKESI
jgi:Predicted transcriptional regulator